MTETWANCRDLAKAFECAVRTIRRKVKREHWRWRNGKPSSNGKLEREYLVPAGHQSKAGLLMASMASANAKPGPVHLTEEQQKVVDDRMKILAPLMDCQHGRSALAAQIATQVNISEANVWRLYGLWKKGGPNALAPVPRKDRGCTRRFKDHPQLRKFATAKLYELGSIAAITRTIRREWGGPLLPCDDGSQPPSRDAISRFLANEISLSALDIARAPKQRWMAKHAPYLTTGRGEYTRPNEMWVGDHRIYDVLVMNDFFPEAGELAAIRLYETAVQDMRTRVIVGSVWSVNPSWKTIATALRQGISRFGMPESFYCDNGKDFRKVGSRAERNVVAEEENRMPGLLARLGIEVRYCTPRHPQAKQIESHFSIVSEEFDQALFLRHGYTGSKPGERPDFCREQEKQHKEFLAGKRRESPFYAASRFMQMHARWLYEFNHDRPHDGRGMKKRPPMEVLDELLPAAERQIPDMEKLEPLFWAVEKRIVSNCKVQLNNVSYSAALQDTDSQAAMHWANGKTLAVHCDPNDPSYALAFEDAPSGRLVARLVSDELAAQAPRSEDEINGIFRQRARLYNAGRELAERALSGVPSEITLLERRGGIQPPAPPLSLPRRAAAAAPRECAEDFIERFRKVN